MRLGGAWEEHSIPSHPHSSASLCSPRQAGPTALGMWLLNHRHRPGSGSSQVPPALCHHSHTNPSCHARKMEQPPPSPPREGTRNLSSTQGRGLRHLWGVFNEQIAHTLRLQEGEDQKLQSLQETLGWMIYWKNLTLRQWQRGCRVQLLGTGGGRTPWSWKTGARE